MRIRSLIHVWWYKGLEALAWGSMKNGVSNDWADREDMWRNRYLSAPGCFQGSTSQRVPLVWVDKTAAGWIGLEPRSTSSRESSLDTESFKLLRDSSTGSRREISPGNQAKIVESRLQRRYLEAKLSRLDEQYQRLLATQLFFQAYCSTKWHWKDSPVKQWAWTNMPPSLQKTRIAQKRRSSMSCHHSCFTHWTAHMAIVHMYSTISARSMMLLSGNAPCDISSPPSGNQQNSTAHSCRLRTSWLEYPYRTSRSRTPELGDRRFHLPRVGVGPLLRRYLAHISMESQSTD